jgi:hypothetical protein
MRIASADQTNPVPTPETAHLTPEQRREYTFIMTLDNGDQYFVPESDARSVSPLIEHMAVMDVYYIIK